VEAGRERQLALAAIAADHQSDRPFRRDVDAVRTRFLDQTLVPHPEEEGGPPWELVVPIGAIRQIAIRAPEPALGRFGFAGFQE
jgi:hypothetical protein